MAGLTPSGLVIKTNLEVLDSIYTKCQDRIDPNWDTDPNNVFNIFTSIFADELSDAWEGVQGTYDASYPKSATDLNLDNVADMVNVQRIPASNSTAPVTVTGTVGSILPASTVIEVTDTKERFLLNTSITLTNTQFSDITITTSALQAGVNYTITVNGIVCNAFFGGLPTTNDVVTALKAQVDLLVTGVTTSLPTSTSLRINVTEVNSIYPIVIGARLTASSVSDIVNATAQNSGVVKAPVGTLVNLLIPSLGITGVTNEVAANEGRLQETDDELRVRRYESVGIIGASTESAIISNVKNLDGVTAAFIIANRTFTTDVDGRPSKSFEVVAEGGDEDEIASKIWSYHPVGIESYGDITRTITDEFLQEQTVKFSRPIDIYFKMEVDYTKYDEESFSATGEQGIKDAVMAYANTLNIGVDVIPQRFFGTVFSSVQGLSSLAIRISSSTDLITWSAFTTSPIAIARKQRSSFDISRIVVAEV